MNNTDYQALADRVVALGVGRSDHSGRAINRGDFYYIGDSDSGGYCAELFVHLWEVAGALLEKMTCMGISELCKKGDGLRYHGWLKDPHKIILVCVEALEVT